MTRVLIASQNSIVYTDNHNYLTGTDNLEICSCIHGLGMDNFHRKTGEKFSLHIDEESNIEESIKDSLKLMRKSDKIVLTIVPGINAHITSSNAHRVIQQLISINDNLIQSFVNQRSDITIINKDGDIKFEIENDCVLDKHPKNLEHNFFENNISRELMICHFKKFNKNENNARKAFIEHDENGWKSKILFNLPKVYKDFLTRENLDFYELGYESVFHEIINDFKISAYTESNKSFMFNNQNIILSLQDNRTESIIRPNTLWFDFFKNNAEKKEPKYFSCEKFISELI